jgi:hypothetical protein
VRGFDKLEKKIGQLWRLLSGKEFPAHFPGTVDGTKEARMAFIGLWIGGQEQGLISTVSVWVSSR